MEFIETSIFTRRIAGLLTDDEYKELQEHLFINPLAGNLITHSGGLRKLRWKTRSKGKRGGIRVIYYWYTQDKQLFMLLVYDKSEKDDLTKKELKLLLNLVEENLL